MCPISFNIYGMKLNEGHFFFWTVIIHFWDKPNSRNKFQKSFKQCFSFQIRKNTVRFAHVPFNFISLYLFVLTFAMKLKNANYKSHWNILVFCDQWKMMSDLAVVHEKVTDFISFPLFGFTAVIKLKSFDFESH